MRCKAFRQRSVDYGKFGLNKALNAGYVPAGLLVSRVNSCTLR